MIIFTILGCFTKSLFWSWSSLDFYLQCECSKYKYDKYLNFWNDRIHSSAQKLKLYYSTDLFSAILTDPNRLRQYCNLMMPMTGGNSKQSHHQKKQQFFKF